MLSEVCAADIATTPPIKLMIKIPDNAEIYFFLHASFPPKCFDGRASVRENYIESISLVPDSHTSA